ncbi:MAG: hypothetical protein ACLQUY_22710 [Ktedonobacterales bacterium]
MTTDDTDEMPLACSLSTDELRQRGAENAALLAQAGHVQELPDGYTLSFPADMAPDLLGFVLAERDCCPFFTFQLTFPSPHEAVQLTIRGRPGVKEIVQSEMVSKVLQDASSEAASHLG